MKKLISFSLITVISVALIYWLGFSDFELGKYDNFQEAIEKGIPYRVNDIIHTEQYDNVTIVMYTTEPNKEDFPFADWEALAVAFFIGSDEKGWKNIGHHGWDHYENDNMTIYSESLREHDNDGNKLHEFYVVFGEVNNGEIIKVETKAKEEEKFEEAKIITAKGKRYYFKIGREMIVRGLSKSGEVIDRQGG
ncbi:hypothetical protein [Gracilibacillus sp. YIM 98692]|uniref:hypothetical protein n=1 Tax=Gracilibacillus sp. YIM 98692 TaxID=2663532 RepID=UPI0013D2E856|nr:hypothetical protein [Gracilibacillus sp. YIM 98692]